MLPAAVSPPGLQEIPAQPQCQAPVTLQLYLHSLWGSLVLQQPVDVDSHSSEKHCRQDSADTCRFAPIIAAAKLGLLKVIVRRERSGHVFVRHHHKTDAIGQAPFFSKTLAVKRPTVCKHARIGRDDMEDS